MLRLFFADKWILLSEMSFESRKFSCLSQQAESCFFLSITTYMIFCFLQRVAIIYPVALQREQNEKRQ